MKLTLEREETGEKIELTFPADHDLEHWVETLKLILKWVSFSNNQIDEILGEEEK